MSAHNRTRRVRGKAAAQSCTGCGGPAKEWALRHDAAALVTDEEGRSYSDDPYDYSAMCFRCHRLMDKASITHCPQGHEYEGDNLLLDGGKRKCRECVYARNSARRKRVPMTPEQKARKIELQRLRRRRLMEHIGVPT